MPEGDCCVSAAAATAGGAFDSGCGVARGELPRVGLVVVLLLAAAAPPPPVVVVAPPVVVAAAMEAVAVAVARWP